MLLALKNGAAVKNLLLSTIRQKQVVSSLGLDLGFGLNCGLGSGLVLTLAHA